MTGIYKITSQKFPDRVYIGSAINIKKRWQCHLSILSKNKHHSPKLQGHVNKYGISDLKFTVLLECEKAELLRKVKHILKNLLKK